ncbi:receptor like protein 30-like [Momordica charantia]|uniref:Receptor like protein 30-like n=1 Tax=Momordica charantia TaxID=3673 RepID=A0A6J1CV52_MOMCH|nr:receptor like protein 30-like [Momordica charantia]
MALLIYQVCSFFLLFLCNSLVNSHHLCDPKESLALLEFKKAFSLSQFAHFGCSEFERQTSYPKTATWKESTDCCSWLGVECDDEGEGHVVRLDVSCSRLNGTLHPNSTIFTLSHLQSLNLSFNSFDSSPFSPQFGMFQNLRVLDLSSSSFKGDVPIEISHLSNLVSLDLSKNDDLKFSNLVMNQLVHNLTKLRNFALANVNLSSITPTSFMNFSLSLTSLSLSSCGLNGNFPSHILSLPNLRVLQLDYNYGLNGHLPMSNWSKSLEILDLVSTNFSGEIPYSIGNAKFLRYLDLSFCNFTGGVPESIGNLTQLNTIHLSENKFNGQFPNSWNNLQKLTNIEIQTNSFMGSLPNSLFNLTLLSHLTASSNFFSSPLPSNVSSHRLSNLIHLNLEGNLLNGAIPSWLYALPRLAYLDLSHNHFNGPMMDFKSTSLNSLDLSENNLQGEISESMHRQVNLTDLKLGSNNLSGVLNLDMLLRIQSLSSLDISNNHQLSIHSTNVSSANLLWVGMRSLKLEKFPYFLRYKKNLMNLDLSDNQLRGEIPVWFSELGSLSSLNVSHNFLSSGIDVLFTLPYLYDIILDFNLFKLPIPTLPPFMNIFTVSNNQLSGNLHPSFCQHTHINFLDLSNNNLSGVVPSCISSSVTFILKLERNNFSGAIPIPSPSFSIYTASENQFSGEIPPSICNATFLGVLSLSNNRLSGTIPPCLTNITSLLVLDLKSNNFSGTIPTCFSRGSQLRSLDLNNNQLEGELPRSLLNCEDLQDLNLGNNKITGYFPHWLESASSLQVLILRSNRFYGRINNSMNQQSFQNLRIIDLSRNRFSGPLPSNLFKNLRAMKEVEVGNKKPKFSIESVYQSSVVVSLKGLELKLEKILLIFKAIDLSSNDFRGEIPMSIGMLVSLKGLNISHNKLTGEIPRPFGNLNNLEWLDLSSNRLSGNIPPQLAALTFLSFLNLSQNQMSGPIPQGKQFATFERSSYIGNLGLCGFPLPKCGAEKDPKSQLLHDEEDEIFEKGFWWKVVFMGYGCGVVLGIFVGYIVFRIGKPLWIVAMVEGKRTSKRQRSKRRNCWPKKRND